MTDDWHRPRSKATHLTEAELARIKEAFKRREKMPDVARELQCSRRTVMKHYAVFRAEGVPEGVTRNPVAVVKRNRFYHSNFEPS